MQTVWWRELYWPIILVACFIGALGCYNLHSAAAVHANLLYWQQMQWVFLGLCLLFVVLVIDYHITESFAYFYYFLTVIALLLVLMFGRSTMGARRWLPIPGFQCQPSEFAKLAVIFCLARFFSQRERSQEGYTLWELFRPLNPSRPLLVALMWLWFFKESQKRDPVIGLLNFIQIFLPQEPLLTLEYVWWWRLMVALCVLLFAYALWRLFPIFYRLSGSEVLHAKSFWQSDMIVSLLLILLSALGAVCIWIWQLPFGSGLQIQQHLRWWIGVFGHGFMLLLVVLYIIASLFDFLQGHKDWLSFLIAPVDWLLLPVVLVLVEPDLGSSMILLSIGMSIILIAGVRGRSLVSLGVLGCLVVCVSWFALLKDYQKKRVITFLDPEQDVQGAGWNAVQSLIAVGSGCLFGKGHLNGTQTQLSFLPEQHTDFAFSVWAEEQGFIGCSLVLVLYFILLAMLLHIALNAKDSYGALLVVGIAALIGWQVFINIAMVSGMLPVVGITLPLFSYGGSSVLTVMLGLGLAINVHLRRKAH